MLAVSVNIFYVKLLIFNISLCNNSPAEAFIMRTSKFMIISINQLNIMRIMCKTSIKEWQAYWKKSPWQLKQVLSNWPDTDWRAISHLEIDVEVYYNDEQYAVKFHKDNCKNYSIARSVWHNRLIKLIDEQTRYFAVYVYYVTPISKKCVEIHESFRKEANND